MRDTGWPPTEMSKNVLGFGIVVERSMQSSSRAGAVDAFLGLQPLEDAEETQSEQQSEVTARLSAETQPDALQS